MQKNTPSQVHMEYHILGQKSNLSKFNKTEIISSIFSNHNAMRLDINYKKKTVRNTNINMFAYTCVVTSHSNSQNILYRNTFTDSLRYKKCSHTCTTDPNSLILKHIHRLKTYSPIYSCVQTQSGFSCHSDDKESFRRINSGDLALVSGLGISPGEGNDYPLQYSNPEKSMNSRSWQARVHGVTKCLK